MRHLFSRIAAARFGKVYDDLAAMEDILPGAQMHARRSGLAGE